MRVTYICERSLNRWMNTPALVVMACHRYEALTHGGLEDVS